MTWIEHCTSRAIPEGPRVQVGKVHLGLRRVKPSSPIVDDLAASKRPLVRLENVGIVQRSDSYGKPATGARNSHLLVPAARHAAGQAVPAGAGRDSRRLLGRRLHD